MLCILIDPQFQDIIPSLKLIGDHFGVEVKRNGDHFGVGIISGLIWGSFRGRDHFGGCTYTSTPTVLQSHTSTVYVRNYYANQTTAGLQEQFFKLDIQWATCSAIYPHGMSHIQIFPTKHRTHIFSIFPVNIILVAKNMNHIYDRCRVNMKAFHYCKI